MSGNHKIKCNGITGKMKQEVAHSQRGSNLRHAWKISCRMSSLFDRYIEDDSLGLRLRMLSGATDWMVCLSGAPEGMDS